MVFQIFNSDRGSAGASPHLQASPYLQLATCNLQPFVYGTPLRRNR